LLEDFCSHKFPNEMTPNAKQTSNTMTTPEYIPGWEHLPPAMRSIAQQSATRKSGAISEIKKKQQEAKFRQEEEDQRRVDACRLRDEQEKRRREELMARSKIVNDIAAREDEAKDEENYNKRRKEACRMRDEKQRKQREETKARAKIVIDLSGKEALLLKNKRFKACQLQDEQKQKRREENKARENIFHYIAKEKALEKDNKRLEACRLRDEKETQRRAASNARQQIVHDIVIEEAKGIAQEEKKRRAMACRLRDVEEKQLREETKARANVALAILRKSLEVLDPAKGEPELKKENLTRPGEDKQKNLKEEAEELRRRLHLLPKKEAKKKLTDSSTAFVKPPAIPQVIEIEATFTYAELKENISKVDDAIQETFKNYPYGLDDFRDLLEKRDEYLDALEKTEEFKNRNAEELVGVSDHKQQQETRSRVDDDIRAILAEEEYKNQLIEEALHNWLRTKEAGQEAH
jgi:hypothetical protein